MFKNRTMAGQSLTEALQGYLPKDSLVLALPRGGVPVAYEIAKHFHLPLAVYLVRKLGFPNQPELAMGAIAENGALYINKAFKTEETALKTAIAKEEKVLEQRKARYRHHRPLPSLQNKTILLVDDGLATGATIKAALLGIQKERPKTLILAVPVAPYDVIQAIKKNNCDEVICLLQPKIFGAVGEFYEDFSQTSDEEVIRLLAEAHDKYLPR